MKKIIVIGAGVSGLSSAAQLAAKGYQVEVFEKNDQPGGRMGQVRAGDFTFDQAPTIVMMPEVYRSVYRNCGEDPDDYIPMQRLNPIYKIYFADGTVHRASSELSELVPALEEAGFEEAQGYLAYLADVYKRYVVAMDALIKKSFNKPTDFWNPKTLAAGLKLKTFDTAYASISKFVKDEKLRELLSFQTLYIGISPFNGPSIYTIIPMIELIYGVWLIKGGMYSMAKGMAALLEKKGGTIRLNSPVEEIVLENGRAVGVRVGNEIHRADAVLCTADLPWAIDKLLPPRFGAGKYKAEKLDKLKYSCSCLMLYLGLDSDQWPGLEVHNLAFSSNFKGNLDDIFKGSFPEDPSLYAYAPGLLDPGYDPAGKRGLYVLVPVANLNEGSVDWSDPQALARIKDVVYDRLERIAPLKGVRAHVESETVFTPRDFESRFNAYAGATFGLRPTLSQSNHLRPQVSFGKTPGLYFAGSSTHPGAGVPIVLTSADLAVAKICEDDGVK